MGILTRILTLWKADLHGVMDQIEDKPLLLKQYLREMDETLRGKEAYLEQLRQTARQLQREADLRMQELERTDSDLDLALRKEKDEIARMLIRKRRAQHALRDQLLQQIETIADESRHVSEKLQQQRLQYDQLKIKAAAACRQAERMDRDAAGSTCASEPICAPPSEEEIELELIQRKEALRRGGAA
jgi:phage shock protein A